MRHCFLHEVEIKVVFILILFLVSCSLDTESWLWKGLHCLHSAAVHKNTKRLVSPSNWVHLYLCDSRKIVFPFCFRPNFWNLFVFYLGSNLKFKNWTLQSPEKWLVYKLLYFALIDALTAVGALMTLIDFTLSKARRFYSLMGNPLAVKGLISKVDYLSL